VALQKNKLTELQAQITEDTSTKELDYDYNDCGSIRNNALEKQ
jgi:hypothetical protein